MIGRCQTARHPALWLQVLAVLRGPLIVASHVTSAPPVRQGHERQLPLQDSDVPVAAI